MKTRVRHVRYGDVIGSRNVALVTATRGSARARPAQIRQC